MTTQQELYTLVEAVKNTFTKETETFTLSTENQIAVDELVAFIKANF